MSVTALKIRQTVASVADESMADKIRRLRNEAQGFARSHSEDLVEKIVALETLAEDIAAGGEAYAVGIREAARKLGPELMQARLNISAILGRDGM